MWWIWNVPWTGTQIYSMQTMWVWSNLSKTLGISLDFFFWLVRMGWSVTQSVSDVDRSVWYTFFWRWLSNAQIKLKPITRLLNIMKFSIGLGQRGTVQQYDSWISKTARVTVPRVGLKSYSCSQNPRRIWTCISFLWFLRVSIIQSCGQDDHLISKQ